MSSKLVLIDGNAIMHRAFHALPPLTTTGGEPINAVYGFVSMILRIIDNIKPTHIAVCFDRKEPTFRKKAFKKYQAHRPETDKDLISQFPKAREVVESFNIPVYDKAGFEADDVIGTLATLAVQSKRPTRNALRSNAGRVKELKSKQNLRLRQKSKKKTSTLPLSRFSTLIDEVVIVTGDKDILQLVNDKVKVYLPKRGLSDARLVGEKEVYELLGVRPDQIVDYKALVGDPSDNYPGVFGIGSKTAEPLLARFGTLQNIYDKLSELDEKIQIKLKKDKKNALLSQKLAEIVTDVPMEFDFGAMSKWNVGSTKTVSLFEQFGFRTLKTRVERVGNKIEKEKQGSLF